MRSTLYPKAIGSNPAMVVKEVRKTGLSLKIAVLSAMSLILLSGLFLFRTLKVSTKTILLLTIIPVSAIKAIPVCIVLMGLLKINKERKTPPNDRTIAERITIA